MFVFNVIRLLMYVATVIDKPDLHTLSQTISIIVIFLIYALMAISKHRIKDRQVYLILILMALFNFDYVCGAEAQLAKVTDIDERIELLRKWLLNILNNFWMSAILISPSLYFLVFGYGLPYTIANIYLMTKYGDSQDKHFVNYASAFPVYALLAIGIFYVFQHRELMRFFELQKSE